MKGEDKFDQTTVIRGFKKFHLGCKNLDNQATSGKPKKLCSKPKRQIQRVSGEFSISRSSEFITFTILAKIFDATELCLQNNG